MIQVVKNELSSNSSQLFLSQRQLVGFISYESLRHSNVYSPLRFQKGVYYMYCWTSFFDLSLYILGTCYRSGGLHFIFHFSLYCNIKKLNVNFWRGNSLQTQNSGGIKRLAMKVLRQVRLYTVQFFTFFPLKLPVIPGSYLQAHTSNAFFFFFM